MGIGAVVLTAIVATIYRDVIHAYYFNDDLSLVASRVSLRASWIFSGALSAVAATEFALSASTLSREFRDGTNPAPLAGAIVYVDREKAAGVPELYWDPAAEVASCGTDVHVVVR